MFGADAQTLLGTAPTPPTPDQQTDINIRGEVAKNNVENAVNVATSMDGVGELGELGAAGKKAFEALADARKAEQAAADAAALAKEAKTTVHGAERLLERGFTEAEITAIKNGRVMIQADGAKVFISETSPGKFSYIVEGEKGIITGIKNLDQKALNNLAKNYGWH